MYKNKKIKNINEDLGDLGFINFVFQNCYLKNVNTEEYFLSLFNKTEMDYSRYIYFYINYLISEKNIKEAKEITDSSDVINSSLLILQTKSWIDMKKFKKINSIFFL